jgi:TonB family protein
MKPSLCRLAIALIASVAAPMAAAQAAAGDGAPTERAKRDADKVREMILLHADKPRRARADERVSPTPAPAVRPAPGADAPVTAPPAVSALAAEPAAPVVRLAVPELAPTPTIAPAAVPAMLAPSTARRSKLELIQGAEPAFPRRLVQSVVSGSVKVAFDVLPDGSVTAVQVLQSPHPGLNAPAVAAVSQWRFQPVAERVSGVTEFKFD